jgi:hypothetical protein
MEASACVVLVTLLIFFWRGLRILIVTLSELAMVLGSSNNFDIDDMKLYYNSN